MPVATPVISSITNIAEKHFNINLTDLVTNATTYSVRFATTAGGSTIQSLLVTNPASASFDMYNVLSSLTLGTTYYVTVAASDSSSTVIGVSNEVVFNYNASVMKPEALYSIGSITTNSFVVTISPQATPTMPTVTSSIIIYASNGTTVVRTLNGPYSVGANVLIDNLTPGSIYFAKITSTNTNGSNNATSASILLDPAPPYNIFVTVNERTLNINWTLDGVIAGLKLYVATGPNQQGSTTPISYITTNATNATVTVYNDGDYYISLTSSVGTGRGSKTSAISSEVHVSISTIPLAHKQSKLLIKDTVQSVDKYTSFLAHYDITQNDVLNGIAPTANISTLNSCEGKFGGMVAIEEGTTNLVVDNGVINWTVNNLGTGQAIVSRTELVPNNKYRITSTSGGTFRFYVPLAKLTSGTAYYMSFKWKMVSGGPNFFMTDWCDQGGINRKEIDYGAYKLQTAFCPARPSGYDNTYRFMDFSISPSTQVEIWDVQVEQKPYPTSYTSGTRTDGQLSYPISLLNLSSEAGTISFWAKLPYSLPYTSSSYMYLYMSTSATGYGGANSLNFWAQNNGYNNRIIGLHWGTTDGATNHIPLDTTQVSNYNNGDWNMYTITWKNPNGYKIYINGKLAGSAASGKILKPFDATALDIRGMFLDELRMDIVERSAEEIESWYISNTPFFPRGVYTVAY